MEDCVFCKIVAGELPAAKLIETDKALSFLDTNPINPGHALIVPKRHVCSMLDLQQDELHATMFLVKRVAAAVIEATGSPAFNVLQSNGPEAGQVIDHCHFHVIPRRADDGVSLEGRHMSYKPGEIEALQQAIQTRL